MQQTLAPARTYLEALQNGVMVFDGAMGTSIQRYNLSAEDFGGKHGCNDYLTLTKPAIIEEIHQSFVEAGAQALETCTFQATRRRLTEWGLGELTYELNVEAARLARKVADRAGGRFVAGAMGPTGMLPSSSDPTLSAITFDELRELFREQATALVDGGVDLLLVETTQDMLELKAALFGIREALAELGKKIPVQAQVTLDVTGRMLLGADISSALATLERLPCDVIGLNCSTGPEHMREPIRYLGQHCSKPISCIPNAGLPVNDGSGEALYLLQPEPMAGLLREFVVDFGVNVIGGCCGTTPEHIRQFVAATQGLMPRRSVPAPEPMIASSVRAVSLLQEPRPLIIGERVNAQGSRKVKQLLLNSDYEGVVQVARAQADESAHALDICCALTERSDEVEQMREVVRRLAMAVETPLVIDSTEADVVEIALKNYPGRPIVNSVHLGEEDRLRKVLPMVHDHGAAVVVMTIDQVGMARTAERKLEVARASYDLAINEYGLAPDDLIFDALTFPLSTGQEELLDSAKETIEAIRAIKRELPGALTVLGVSNVSFGFNARSRPLLNSLFLHHALEAGLDMAIVHPSHVLPIVEIPAAERKLAEDLIFNRGSEALPHFIAYFEAAGEEAANAAPAADPLAGLPAEERIHQQILHRKKQGIEAAIDEALTRHTPVEVLNEVLLPAMRHVGDLFGAGELILPYVLQSAEVMKAAVAHLEQFLEKREGYTKGVIVLATVFGDVHDIGKNLVGTILSNNGYTVHDLGKQVPINRIVDKAVEVGADAIGLSALLVSTSKQMPLCVQELHRRGLNIPVLVGGAAINPRFGYRILFLDEQRPYDPGVFYNKDAFEGLSAMDSLVDVEQREAFVADRKKAAALSIETEAKRDAARGQAEELPPARVRAITPPTPPFWGASVIDRVDPDELFQRIDRLTLFSLHWGGSKKHGAEREKLFREEFEPLLAQMWSDCLSAGLIVPWATYGYFHAQASGESVVIGGQRFDFPRQATHERLCLADYFGSEDVAPLQFVTVGGEITRRIDALQAAGEYSKMYFLHGLGVATAEALAELVHRRIQRELNLSPGQGKRYSWGYPACPDLTQHRLVFNLLPARSNPAVDLTELCELVPEQSTAALVVHHPDAIYFSQGIDVGR